MPVNSPVLSPNQKLFKEASIVKNVKKGCINIQNIFIVHPAVRKVTVKELKSYRRNSLKKKKRLDL